MRKIHAPAPKKAAPKTAVGSITKKEKNDSEKKGASA
jgi:hypothetical protein